MNVERVTILTRVRVSREIRLGITNTTMGVPIPKKPSFFRVIRLPRQLAVCRRSVERGMSNEL